MSDEKIPGGDTDEKLINPETKLVKNKKDDKGKDFKKLLQEKFIEYRGEFRKIIWLSQSELTKRTITVIVTSVLFALVIFGMDSIMSLITQNFYLLVSK